MPVFLRVATEVGHASYLHYKTTGYFLSTTILVLAFELSGLGFGISCVCVCVCVYLMCVLTALQNPNPRPRIPDKKKPEMNRAKFGVRYLIHTLNTSLSFWNKVFKSTESI